jgi:hypothetical protein
MVAGIVTFVSPRHVSNNPVLRVDIGEPLNDVIPEKENAFIPVLLIKEKEISNREEHP